MALRIVPNILKYSRESIFGVVRNAPSTDLYHFPGSLSTWVRAYLTDYGVYEFGPVPEQEDQEIAGELEQPEIEDSQPEPEVVSMGVANSTYPHSLTLPRLRMHPQNLRRKSPQMRAKKKKWMLLRISNQQRAMRGYAAKS